MNFYEELGTPLLDGTEEPELTEPEDFLLPTRAELDAKAAETDDNADDAADAADGDKDGKNDDAKDADAGKSDDADTEVADAGVSMYVAEVADPGEYVPADYSFEVTVFDENNANPKTVKVATPEDFDKLLEGETNFGSAAALMKASRLATKMESKLEADKAAYDKAVKAYNADQAQAEAANAVVTAMESGLDYLVSKGELPTIAKKYVNADWSDPEVAKQPGVKEQLELMKYMQTENAARVKAGLGPFGSIVDAFNQMDRDNARKTIKTAQDKAGEARRAAGMRVGASNPAPVSNVPKGVMVGRSFGSLDNL